MDNRLTHSDSSLNAQMSEDSTNEMIDYIKSDMPTPEVKLITKQEFDLKNLVLKKAILTLDKREQDIIISRRLKEKSFTLDILSKKYNISKERVRQIEVKAFEKVKSLVKLEMTS